MAILDSDIKLLKSQVLADVPEGGGAATGVEIADGVSNNLFNDISDLDRVYGAVDLRKIFLNINTPTVDQYLGANMIVATPPVDPDVSAVLFRTGDSFDTRVSAQGRIESYLAQGSVYQGLLYGNHITGQSTVTLAQRDGVPVPAPGDTLLVRKNEGLTTQTEQYVRVLDVTSRLVTFTDAQGDFTRQIVVVSLSDQLRADYPGFDAVRFDAAISYVGKTKTYNTLVADAARYYGIVPLTLTGGVNDFIVKASSIFTQLVPSSRSEIPIADAKMNQAAAMVVAQSDSQLVTLSAVGATNPMFCGCAITPGSLTIGATIGAGVLTDSGGFLISSTGAKVGVVDYANGVIQDNNSGAYGNGVKTISFKPAASVATVSDSIGIPVKASNQRFNYVTSIVPPPAPGSLQVSYRAQGRWYVLQDDGSGALRGSDASVGAGTVNFATGTVTATLGALPDLKSYVILGYARKEAAPVITAAQLQNGGAAYLELSFGVPVKPGSITITWSQSGYGTFTTRDLNGSLTGETASAFSTAISAGVVYYSTGRMLYSPRFMMPPGTIVTFTATSAAPAAANVTTLTDSGQSWTVTLTAPVQANSVEMSVVGQRDVAQYPVGTSPTKFLLRVFDNGSGQLVVNNLSLGTLQVGTINYSTGAIALNKSVAGYRVMQDTFVLTDAGESVFGTSYTHYQTGPQVESSVPLTILNGGGSALPLPTWAWVSAAQTDAAVIRYVGGDAAVVTSTLSVTSFKLSVNPALQSQDGSITYSGGGIVSSVPAWSQVRFTLTRNSTPYNYVGDVTTGKIVWQVSPATGVGSPAGTMIGNVAIITAWDGGGGMSTIPTNFGGARSVPVVGGTPLLSDGVVFRTASAPLVPSAFSVQGTLRDSSTFNVSADSDGVIKGGGVVGRVDYDSGVVVLRFGTVSAGTPGQGGVIDVSSLNVPGVSALLPTQAQITTLKYNAVAYTYLPLDADILGLDPVRLPSDGRVPIFRPGSVAVVHNTQTTVPTTVMNGGTIDVGRTRLSRMRLIGSDGKTITAGYTVDLAAGVMTFVNVTGYAQPVRVEHRIEDTALVTSAQITGEIGLQRPLTHTYPVGSYVSSALLIGDMAARVSALYDQTSWTNVWSDDLIGTAAAATYNAINYPITVANNSAVNERWVLVFTSTTAFQILGEHYGLIGTGTTAGDVAPINPATNLPFFTMSKNGFGTGWAVGNAIRITTVGALAPVWVARVVKQGVPTANSDSFTIATRGDVDTP